MKKTIIFDSLNIFNLFKIKLFRSVKWIYQVVKKLSIMMVRERVSFKKIILKDLVGVMDIWRCSFNMPSNTSLDLLI